MTTLCELRINDIGEFLSSGQQFICLHTNFPSNKGGVVRILQEDGIQLSYNWIEASGYSINIIGKGRPVVKFIPIASRTRIRAYLSRDLEVSRELADFISENRINSQMSLAELFERTKNQDRQDLNDEIQILHNIHGEFYV